MPAGILAARMALALPAPLPGCLGVAVSGGGDSLALMVLVAEWCRSVGVTLRAATVDHGLRAEAATEARQVAATATALGVPHDTLVWRDRSGRGNLQAEARSARQTLLTGWARDHGIGYICLGHTRDDQAETVLLRLARGSGVDGLSAMSLSTCFEDGPVWLRPLLTVRRATLRDVLRTRDLDWAEDPSNQNLQFDRIKARQLLAAVPLPGLDVDHLADTADRMAAARRVLSRVARDAAQNVVEIEGADVVFSAPGLVTLEDETRWRLLAEALCRVSSSPYRPRLKALRAAEAELAAGRQVSLHGCLIVPGHDRLRVLREPAAVASLAAPAPGRWDGRWQVEGPEGTGFTLRALGPAGLAERPGWRTSGIHRLSLLSSPAVWKNAKLVAVPVLDASSGWQARLSWGKTEFCAGLLSH